MVFARVIPLSERYQEVKLIFVCFVVNMCIKNYENTILLSFVFAVHIKILLTDKNKL